MCNMMQVMYCMYCQDWHVKRLSLTSEYIIDPECRQLMCQKLSLLPSETRVHTLPCNWACWKLTEKSCIAVITQKSNIVEPWLVSVTWNSISQDAGMLQQHRLYLGHNLKHAELVMKSASYGMIEVAHACPRLHFSNWCHLVRRVIYGLLVMLVLCHDLQDPCEIDESVWHCCILHDLCLAASKNCNKSFFLMDWAIA